MKRRFGAGGRLIVGCVAAIVVLGAGFRLALPPIHDAAAHGNLDEVQRIISSDPNALLSRDEGGAVALHHAAWNGWVLVVKALLAAGTPVDITKDLPNAGDGTDGWTALHHAAAQGQVDVLKELLQAGARVDFQAKDGSIPLHQAAWGGHTEAVKLLLDARSDPNARRTTNRVTPLESASYFGHTDTVKLLLSRGADPNARVYEGYTAMHQAARQGNIAVMEALFLAKASIETQKDDGQTPLHAAAASGQVGAVQSLLTMGAEPNAKDSSGDTPLAVAQKNGQGGTASLLTEYLASLNEMESLLAVRKALNKSLPKGKVSEAVVYQNDFANGVVGDEWSWTPTGPYFAELRLTRSPKTNKQFLGDFGDQNVRLTLYQLPAHEQVTVTMDLLIINTWDGSGIESRTGVDLWEASVTGGPVLLRSSFANYPPDPKLPNQSFPNDYPLGHFPGGTGAIAKNVLGMPVEGHKPTDAIYRLKFTFAHTTPYLVLNFQGKGLQELNDESWGIGRIEVRTGRAIAAPKPR